MLKKSYSMMDKNGILYGIGVGPGEPELMTLKALRIIRSCDVIVLPAASKEACYAYKIAYEVCPEIEEKILLCMPFPMIQDEEELELAHEKNYHEIEDYLCEGKNVGMLTIGDPSVYSTYLYMHHRAVKAGFQSVMISGVPSFCASACRLGISLGEKNEEIHIIPASYSIEEALKYSGTCIYMKSGRHLKELLAGLREQQEKGRRLRAYGVANCGMENEQVYQGLEELEKAEGYLVTVIVKMEYCLPRRFRAGVKKEWKKI
ncbi:MAG: precorrin-2 C(20)-methyltransferase [Roseburia sp.]|nr:precorrin-2 C(20)-methyltransferase [Roseburia sp.]